MLERGAAPVGQGTLGAKREPPAPPVADARRYGERDAPKIRFTTSFESTAVSPTMELPIEKRLLNALPIAPRMDVRMSMIDWRRELNASVMPAILAEMNTYGFQ